MDEGSCRAAGARAHEPFTQLFEREHGEREGDYEEPDDKGNRRGAEERVAPRRVGDQRDEQDLRRDPGEDQLVAHEAAGEQRLAFASAEEDVRDLHDYDGAEAGGRGLEIEWVACS